jgi:hypothetical protein
LKPGINEAGLSVRFLYDRIQTKKEYGNQTSRYAGTQQAKKPEKRRISPIKYPNHSEPNKDKNQDKPKNQSEIGLGVIFFQVKIFILHSMFFINMIDFSKI